MKSKPSMVSAERLPTSALSGKPINADLMCPIEHPRFKNYKTHCSILLKLISRQPFDKRIITQKVVGDVVLGEFQGAT